MVETSKTVGLKPLPVCPPGSVRPLLHAQRALQQLPLALRVPVRPVRVREIVEHLSAESAEAPIFGTPYSIKKCLIDTI